MKKKLLILVLALIMVFSLVGCKETEKVAKNVYEGYDLSQYVKLPDYLSYSYEKPVIEVTEEDIDNEINNLLNSKLEKNYLEEGVIKEEDLITISFSGVLEDGSKPSAMQSSSFEMEVGITSMIDGFTEAIIGHSVGDEFVAHCVFPDPYTNDPSLAGKKADFTIKILNLIEQTVPELTDEWVKTNTDYKSIITLRDGIKTDLEAEKTAEAENKLKSEIFERLIDEAEVLSLIDDRVNAEKDIVDRWLRNMANVYEMEWDEYLTQELEYDNEAEYEESLQSDAEEIVNYDMVIYAYAQAEGITVLQSEFDAITDQFLQYSGMKTAEEFLENYAISIEEYVHLTGYDLDLYANAFMEKLYDQIVK